MQRPLNPFYLTLIFSLTWIFAQAQTDCETLRGKTLSKTIHFFGKDYEIQYNPIKTFCSDKCNRFPDWETDACAYFYKNEKRATSLNDFDPKTGEWLAPSFFSENSEGKIDYNIFYSSAIFRSIYKYQRKENWDEEETLLFVVHVIDEIYAKLPVGHRYFLKSRLMSSSIRSPLAMLARTRANEDDYFALLSAPIMTTDSVYVSLWENRASVILPHNLYSQEKISKAPDSVDQSEVIYFFVSTFFMEGYPNSLFEIKHPFFVHGLEGFWPNQRKLKKVLRKGAKVLRKFLKSEHELANYKELYYIKEVSPEKMPQVLRHLSPLTSDSSARQWDGQRYKKIYKNYTNPKTGNKPPFKYAFDLKLAGAKPFVRTDYKADSTKAVIKLHGAIQTKRGYTIATTVYEAGGVDFIIYLDKKMKVEGIYINTKDYDGPFRLPYYKLAEREYFIDLRE